MAKKRNTAYAGEHPFPAPQRPNNDWAYRNGMVPENAKEFGSAPSGSLQSRFPHYRYGVAGLGAALEDGKSGMDRHVSYIVPTHDNDLFE